MTSRNPTPPNNRGRSVSRIGAVSNAKLLKFMMEGVYNNHELAEHTGLHYKTVAPYVKAMHKEGVVHIAGYDEDARGSETIAIYKLGMGKDKEPRRFTRAELSERYRAKKKAMAMVQVMGGAARFVHSKNNQLRIEKCAPE